MLQDVTRLRARETAHRPLSTLISIVMGFLRSPADPVPNQVAPPAADLRWGLFNSPAIEKEGKAENLNGGRSVVDRTTSFGTLPSFGGVYFGIDGYNLPHY